MMSLTLAEGERIARFLDLKTSLPEHADFAFVFGTYHPDPGSIAANLWKSGIVPRVILTGGQNRLTGEIEANRHLEILLQSGVPRDRIVVEAESTNTRENVVFALRELAKCHDPEGIQSLVVVAKWYHSRRAMMTLRRYLPAGVRYFATTYEVDGITRSDWWLTEEGRRRITKEQQLIAQDLARGYLAQVREDDGLFL